MFAKSLLRAISAFWWIDGAKAKSQPPETADAPTTETAPADLEALGRDAFAAADGERPVPMSALRVPPHQRHLAARPDDMLLAYVTQPSPPRAKRRRSPRTRAEVVHT